MPPKSYLSGKKNKCRDQNRHQNDLLSQQQPAKEQYKYGLECLSQPIILQTKPRADLGGLEPHADPAKGSEPARQKKAGRF